MLIGSGPDFPDAIGILVDPSRPFLGKRPVLQVSVGPGQAFVPVWQSQASAPAPVGHWGGRHNVSPRLQHVSHPSKQSRSSGISPVGHWGGRRCAEHVTRYLPAVDYAKARLAGARPALPGYRARSILCQNGPFRGLYHFTYSRGRDRDGPCPAALTVTGSLGAARSS